MKINLKNALAAALSLALSIGPVVATAQPVGSSSGTATAARQDTLYNAFGAAADSACPTDNGTCAAIRLWKRNNQLLTTLGGYVDGVEALITSTNGYVDGLEASNGAPADAAWTTGSGSHTAILKAIDGHVDGIEALITTLNGKIDTLDSRVDGLEGAIGTTADAAWTSGSGSLVSLGKAQAGAAIDATIPAFKTDQTTHGATDLVAADFTKLGGSTIQAASNGLNITGTGLFASALVGQLDETSPATITENSFGHLRMSPGHMLYSALIAGQDGVDGNTGAASAKTVRVVLANESTAQQGSTGAAVPAKATYMGANSGGNLTGIIQADTSAPVSMSTAATVQMVALTSSSKIYVTAWDLVAAGTTNGTWVYGTGTNCGTGTTSLSGAYPMVANSGVAKGSGLGPVLIVPASNALCLTSSAAVQLSGTVAYMKAP